MAGAWLTSLVEGKQSYQRREIYVIVEISALLSCEAALRSVSVPVIITQIPTSLPRKASSFRLLQLRDLSKMRNPALDTVDFVDSSAFVQKTTE